MKKAKILPHAMQAVLFALALLGLASCTDTPSSPIQKGGGVEMRTESDNSVIHPFTTPSENTTRGFGMIADSLQVTSAAFVVSDFKLRSDADEIADDNFSEESIRNEQFLLGFEGGSQYIGGRTVLAGTYLRVKFALHPLQGNTDSLALTLGLLYSTLFTNSAAENTVVIHGFVWKDGLKMPFTYNSKASGNESIMFDKPLVITTGGGQTEVLVHFNSLATFSTGEGFLMDPRDARNASGIETNLKHSLKATITEGS